MIDELVREIPNAQQGFVMLFSVTPFPGHQKRLTWVREDIRTLPFSLPFVRSGWRVLESLV
jgi:hypothetical protein